MSDDVIFFKPNRKLRPLRESLNRLVSNSIPSSFKTELRKTGRLYSPSPRLPTPLKLRWTGRRTGEQIGFLSAETYTDKCRRIFGTMAYIF